MNIKRNEIILKNLQIKNLKKAKKLAKALEIIEEECGIHEVRISVENIYVCPWINIEELKETQMEIFLAELLNKH